MPTDEMYNVDLTKNENAITGRSITKIESVPLFIKQTVYAPRVVCCYMDV